MPALDWQGVLAGQPLHWLLSGFLTTLWVTLAGIMLASLLTLFFMLFRLSGGRFGTLIVSGCFAIRRCWYSCCSGISPPGTGCRRGCVTW